jgi:uncharacterized membrane protein YbhN (UPF0104 family)
MKRTLPGPRLFATPVDEPRARRATDAISAAASAAGLVLLGWVTSPPSGFETALSGLFAAVPDFFGGLWRLLVGLPVVMAVLSVVVAAARRRIALARDLVLAAVLGLLTAIVAARLVDGSWPDVLDALQADSSPPLYPAARLAVAGAVVMTASPHLTRPVRRLGRWLLAGAALGLVLLDATSPVGALAGLLVASLASAFVHLAFGSSGGRPGLDHVAAALEQLGVRSTALRAADRQAAGVFLVRAEREDGEPLLVKVYGRDAHDTQLVATLWRTVWFREPGTSIFVHRLQQVEHEAFLTLLAAQAGIPTDAVVTAGATVEDDALLVLRPRGRPLGDVVDHRPDDLVRQVWALVERLHRAGIVHGQIDDRHLVVLDEEPALGLVDYRGAAVGPTEAQLRTDEVQAILTTALLAGPEAALRGALDALGPEGLAAALPFLQTASLTRPQRARLDDDELDLDDLRTRAAELAGVEPPELQKLRRVSIGGVLQVVLLGVAFFSLLSAMSGLDLEQMLDEFSEASWHWVVIGAVVAQLPRFSQALSTLGASPIPLPLGHLYALQLAVSYVNLAIPSTAARVAVNVRFFQRHGLPPGSALAVGAIDGFGGFVIQICLLLGILTLTDATLGIELDLDILDGSGAFAFYALVVLVSVATVVAAVARVRRFIVHWVTTLVREAVAAVRGIRSPRRFGMLLGGNLLTEVLFALALGAFARAFGFPIGLGELLLINLTVALLSGLIPVPGGIGVTEAGLTYGLVSFGMPEETAFAAVIMHRLAAFYLPPIWGFFAFRWLERNNHL